MNIRWKAWICLSKTFAIQLRYLGLSQLLQFRIILSVWVEKCAAHVTSNSGILSVWVLNMGCEVLKVYSHVTVM